MCKRPVVVMFLGLAVFAGLCAQVATAAEPARPKQLDLSCIGADVWGVMVVHPQQIARLPEVAAFLKDENVAGALKEFSFDPMKIEEIVGQMLLPSKEPLPIATLFGERMAVRFSPTVDIDEMAKLMVGGRRRPGKIVAVTVAGKKCYKFEEIAKEPAKTEKSAKPVRRPPLPEPIACLVDNRTVLVCVFGEADLKKMLAGGEVKSPLVERLRRLDASDDIVAVFALEPMRESIQESLAEQKRFSPTSPAIPYSEMLLLLKSATIRADLSDDARTSAVLEAEDAAGAARVEELVKTLQQVAKDDLKNERKRLDRMPEQYRKSAEEGMSLAEKLLDAMTWTKSASQVTITLKGSKGLMGEGFAKLVLERLTLIRGIGPVKKEPAPPKSRTKRRPKEQDSQAWTPGPGKEHSRITEAHRGDTQ